MLFEALISLSDDVLQGKPDGYSREELALLRNRIYLSWVLWVVAFGCISIELSGFFETEFLLILCALLLMLVSRVLRSIKRPPIRPWHIRRHFYTLTYFLPTAAAFAILLDHQPPIPLFMWSFLAISYGVLFHVQLRDDLGILRVIRTVLSRS